MAFSKLWLDALKAKSKTPEEHFEPDPRYRGLAIRVAPSGRKTWTFHYTFETRRRRLDFGHYPVMPLKEARHQALDYRRALESEPPLDPRRSHAARCTARARLGARLIIQPAVEDAATNGPVRFSPGTRPCARREAPRAVPLAFGRA